MKRAWAVKLGSGGRCVPFCEKHHIISWVLVGREQISKQLVKEVRRCCGNIFRKLMKISHQVA